jgi:hypothetical protein
VVALPPEVLGQHPPYLSAPSRKHNAQRVQPHAYQPRPQVDHASRL